jgi:hypothetical protein
MATTQRNIDIVKSELVDPRAIDQNTGQIPDVPPNPREIEYEYQKLKTSLKNDDDFTEVSEVILYPYKNRYVAISGNMRVRAVRELGWDKLPAKVLPADTPPEVLTRYILLGNADYGKWDTAALADKWADIGLDDLNVETPPAADDLNPDDLGEDFELPDGDRSDERGITFSLSAAQSEYLNYIIGIAKASGLTPDPRYNNADEDANYIHLIAKQWDEQKK